jgi:hypothetical protein
MKKYTVQDFVGMIVFQTKNTCLHFSSEQLSEITRAAEILVATDVEMNALTPGRVISEGLSLNGAIEQGKDVIAYAEKLVLILIRGQKERKISEETGKNCGESKIKLHPSDLGLPCFPEDYDHFH